MTTLLPTLNDRIDRASILASILETGCPRPGVTLVAVMELNSGDIVNVRHLATPDPLPSEACDVPSELARLMSPTLRSLADEIVPAPAPGDGFVPRHELVTVVCREGEATISATEEQFFWGWRYSNHLSPALHGDVYVITPTGWAGLLSGSGNLPALVQDPPDADVDLIAFPELAERAFLLNEPAVREAASLLAATALAEMPPHRNECLLCYVSRLLHVLGCDRSLRIAERFREVNAPRATAMARRLKQIGATCDCQIEAVHGIRSSVIEYEDTLAEQFPDAPRLETALRFGCYGVRKGSTQPCLGWMRR